MHLNVNFAVVWPRHLHRVPNHFVEVHGSHGFVRLTPGKCSDPKDHLRTILYSLFDHLEPLRELRIVDMSLEQLDSGEDHAQEVIEVMRHTGRHLAKRAKLLRPD